MSTYTRVKDHKINLFSSSFFLFEELVDSDNLDKMVDSIKNNSPDEAEKGESVHGPTYKTNFHTRNLYGTIDLTECINILNEKLKNERSFVELGEQPWYAEYGSTDCHDPHLHCNYQYNIISGKPYPEYDARIWHYSMIINLSNIGSTTFFNSNYSGLSSPFKSFSSKRGNVLLFPSNILHWVSPHRVDGQIRRIISANLFLKFEEEWLCS